MSDRLPADPFHYAHRWLAGGHGVALATVAGMSGSSPRPLGSMMVMGSDGRVEGSVSGGCVEADVIRAGREIIAGAPPALLRYGGAGAEEWGIRLACGGSLSVFVEAFRGPASPQGTFSHALLEGIIRGMRERTALTLVRSFDGQHHAVFGEGEETAGSDPVPSDILAAGRKAGAGKCVRLGGGSEPGWFWQSICPPVRLVVIGAVHIAQALTTMGRAMGFETIVIDPRGDLATPERFRDASLIADWPDEAIAALKIDSRTAIVTLTHDSKLDDPALTEAVKSAAFYVGALGSRRTHAARLSRLSENGVAKTLLKKIRGPVGLPIGAVGAQEIAVSILADIVAVRRGAPLAIRQDWWSPAAGTRTSGETSCAVGAGGELL
ncbi:xanthine dehydrogenase [Acetobacter musti]|uniref:Xanthine dehydrogenase n=1 Tax=Acetobacter musti TaxID=864732 RepID=A0ABX0JIH0_9PROT|nr:XdhC/CoxI family protein [Acetobacter musti]NHN83291.1 xanthine dehydrogenase [Acetobacter musti]